MAKSRTKTEVKTVEKTEKKLPAAAKMTTVSFRTRVLLKRKAEAVFEDLGISTSAAINMFFAQVVREKGMPFRPSAQHKAGNTTRSSAATDPLAGEETDYIALEELWNEL